MTDLNLQPRAFAKAILHALKYPHKPVFGVLLAHSEGIQEEQTSSKPGPVAVEDAWALFHSPPACAPMLELSLMQVDELCLQQRLRVVGLYAANQPSSSRDSKDSQEDGSEGKNSTAVVEAGSGSSRTRSLLPQELLKVASTNSYLLMLDVAGLRQALNPEEGFTAAPVGLDTVFQIYVTSGSSTWQRVTSGKATSGGGKPQGKKGDAGSKSEIEAEGSSAMRTGIAMELAQEYAKEPWRLQDEFSDFEDHLDDISRDWLNEHILK